MSRISSIVRDTLPTGVVGTGCHPLRLSTVMSNTAMSNDTGGGGISGVEPGVYDVVASAENVGQVIRHRQKLVTDSTLAIAIFKEYRRFKNGIDNGGFLTIGENPFYDRTTLEYNIPEAFGTCALIVTNALGQVAEKRILPDHAGMIEAGHLVAPGIYFLSLECDGMPVQTVKLLKNN